MKHTDPVCGMQVDEKDAAAGKSTHKGRDYYFCSPHCKTKFDNNPDQFLVNAPRQ
jgi:Cu+-exporting ATPase